MANFFKNRVINEVGTTPIQILETTSSTRATVIGLSLANLTGSNILASITITDDASTVGYYMKDIIIAPNSSLRVVNGGEKLILAPENSLHVFCSQDESLDLVLSYVEIA
jgi:hypothetical protein